MFQWSLLTSGVPILRQKENIRLAGILNRPAWNSPGMNRTGYITTRLSALGMSDPVMEPQKCSRNPINHIFHSTATTRMKGFRKPTIKVSTYNIECKWYTNHQRVGNWLQVVVLGTTHRYPVGPGWPLFRRPQRVHIFTASAGWGIPLAGGSGNISAGDGVVSWVGVEMLVHVKQ